MRQRVEEYRQPEVKTCKSEWGTSTGAWWGADAGAPAGGEAETGTMQVVRKMQAEGRPSAGRGGSRDGRWEDGVAAATAVDLRQRAGEQEMVESRER